MLGVIWKKAHVSMHSASIQTHSLSSWLDLALQLKCCILDVIAVLQLAYFARVEL